MTDKRGRSLRDIVLDNIVYEPFYRVWYIDKFINGVAFRCTAFTKNEVELYALKRLRLTRGIMYANRNY